jgi:hypothetical protein
MLMKTKLFLIILVIIITLLLSYTFAQDIYPTTIGEMTTQITIGGNGTIKDLKEGEEVKFQTLTFQETNYQKIIEINEELLINGKIIKPTHSYDEFNNKYVNFSIKENGTFTYEIKAKIKTTSEIHEINDYNIGTYEEKITEFIKNSEKIESNSSEIITLTNNKLIKNNFLDSLNRTIFWVNEYVEYAKGDDFKIYYLLQKSAIETLLEKKGVCDEFANLAAAILRAKNIPTRIVIGITFDGLEWGNHAWIEVYHKDLGWIPSDPTFRESGFVDATHIKIGSFKDITQSLAKATYPVTTNVSFQTQTLPKIEIIEKEYFNEVELTIKTNEIKTKQWNEIKIEVENLTKKTIVAPITIRENYKEILIQEKSKSIILKPQEKGEVVFKVYPTIELKANELARGVITFNTLSKPTSKEITINYGEKSEFGEIVINDITPITTKTEILFDITATNYSPTKGIIDININNEQREYFWSEEILPFTKQNYRKKIENNQTKQEIFVETKTQRVEQNFYPLFEKIDIKETPKETTVIQKIEPKKDVNENIITTISKDPQLLLFALLPALAIILFGLFLTRKQYI